MLKLAGDTCERLLAERLCNVPVQEMQLDEVWTFVQKKQKNVTAHESSDLIGDAYTFIGLERTSKLVVAWHLGKRDRINTEDFISKLRRATADGEFDVCTDGFQPYVSAIDAGLSDRANYSQVVKSYSKPEEGGRERYSPGEFVTVEKTSILGSPDMSRARTSHVERKNGTLRQWCKRLTYAFSKKWENLKRR